MITCNTSDSIATIFLCPSPDPWKLRLWWEMWRKKRTFFSHLFKPTFSCLFYSCHFSPHPKLSPPLKLLGQIYDQANLDYVKCIFNVEQVSPLLIFSIFYKCVVHFCGIVVIHRATCDGWVPSCWRCHRRSWAKLMFPREKCSTMSVWLVSAHAPDLQAATCNSLNAILAPAPGFGKQMTSNV